MRFGRIILASLTALAAYSYACEAQALQANASGSFPRLLQFTVPLFVAASESASPAPAAPAANHAVFTIEALTATPLGGSICLLASFIAVDLYRRRHQRALLRI